MTHGTKHQFSTAKGKSTTAHSDDRHTSHGKGRTAGEDEAIVNDTSMKTAEEGKKSDLYVCGALHDIRATLKRLAESVPKLPKNADKAKFLVDIVTPRTNVLSGT